MEIKINKEMKHYRESIFFGLSARQFFCAGLAVGIAVLLYLVLRPWGKETASWLCIVGAAPPAAAGFFQYHELSLEQFLWAAFKSQVLGAGKRVYAAENLFYTAITKGKNKHEIL